MVTQVLRLPNGQLSASSSLHDSANPDETRKSWKIVNKKGVGRWVLKILGSLETIKIHGD